MALWQELILRYHTEKKIKTLVVHDCPLWKNDAIGRQLSPEDISIVMEEFCKSGHGEWQDDNHTRCRILWRKPEQLATDIYQWAEAHQYINNVATLYELHSGTYQKRRIYLIINQSINEPLHQWHAAIESKFSSLIFLSTLLFVGEDVNGMSFQGADEELLRRALSILEDQGKCAIFKGETSQEDGIKFFG